MQNKYIMCNVTLQKMGLNNIWKLNCGIYKFYKAVDKKDLKSASNLNADKIYVNLHLGLHIFFT